LDVCERIRVNKKNINKTDFEKIYRQIEKNFSTFGLTPFEKIICCALNFFDNQKAELIILEAGLGGRLDATTAHKSRPIFTIFIWISTKVILFKTFYYFLSWGNFKV